LIAAPNEDLACSIAGMRGKESTGGHSQRRQHALIGEGVERKDEAEEGQDEPLLTVPVCQQLFARRDMQPARALFAVWQRRIRKLAGGK
jgi:hypothetical protein